MSTLFVVATPIGNLGDITLRAAETLKNVSAVVAEDTRVTRKLLNHLETHPRLESLHEHTNPERVVEIAQLLESGDIAYVTDAGTPGISDPGSKLVEAAVQAGHTVEPLPGASAVTSALSITGWSFDRFLFVGFLPRKSGERIELLESVRDEPGPVVFYESPNRISKSLDDIQSVFPERELVICRELTKKFEETFRGTASSALAHFTSPKGEFVVAIQGTGISSTKTLTDDEILAVIDEARTNGLAGRRLVDSVVESTGIPKSRVYPLTLK